MSNYRRYYCGQCNQVSGRIFNNAPEKLDALLKAWPQLQMIESIIKLDNGWYETNPLHFLRDHNRHQIMICDEYYRFEGLEQVRPPLQDAARVEDKTTELRYYCHDCKITSDLAIDCNFADLAGLFFHWPGIRQNPLSVASILPDLTGSVQTGTIKYLIQFLFDHRGAGHSIGVQAQPRFSPDPQMTISQAIDHNAGKMYYRYHCNQCAELSQKIYDYQLGELEAYLQAWPKQGDGGFFGSGQRDQEPFQFLSIHGQHDVGILAPDAGTDVLETSTMAPITDRHSLNQAVLAELHKQGDHRFDDLNPSDEDYLHKIGQAELNKVRAQASSDQQQIDPLKALSLTEGLDLYYLSNRNANQQRLDEARQRQSYLIAQQDTCIKVIEHLEGVEYRLRAVALYLGRDFTKETTAEDWEKYGGPQEPL